MEVPARRQQPPMGGVMKLKLTSRDKPVRRQQIKIWISL